MQRTKKNALGVARVVQNSNVLIRVARRMTLTKRRWMDEKCRELALMQEVGKL